MFSLYRVQYHKRRVGQAPMDPVTVYVVASSEGLASHHVTAQFDPEVDEIQIYAVQAEKQKVQIADESPAIDVEPMPAQPAPEKPAVEKEEERQDGKVSLPGMRQRL